MTGAVAAGSRRGAKVPFGRLGRGLPLLAAAVSIAACATPTAPVRQLPTAEERAARERFVESRRFDPLLRDELLSFRITPEEALRRQAYVDGQPGLAPALRRTVLLGQISPRMRPEHVLASWGEPDSREDRSTDRAPIETWTYRRLANPYDERRSVYTLTFERSILVDLRVDAAE